jgi:transposase
MAGERYNEEFKVAAVKQVTEGGYSIADVAKRLGITTKSLYNWRDRYGENAQAYQEKQTSSDVFNSIELFYNPTRRHGNNNDLSPMEYEKKLFFGTE